MSELKVLMKLEKQISFGEKIKPLDSEHIRRMKTHFGYKK